MVRINLQSSNVSKVVMLTSCFQIFILRRNMLNNVSYFFLSIFIRFQVRTVIIRLLYYFHINFISKLFINWSNRYLFLNSIFQTSLIICGLSYLNLIIIRSTNANDSVKRFYNVNIINGCIWVLQKVISFLKFLS